MADDSIWKDILSWETEIHKKDEALLRRKPIHDQALPPVKKSTEIMLDDNVKPVGMDTFSTTSQKTTTSKAIPKTRAEKAEAEKAKVFINNDIFDNSKAYEFIQGNEYFGKKDYKNAVIYYGKAIDLDPTVPVYFVNRAMAYLKTNRGLQLQPRNVKALWRRGIALRELGRINEAREDFQTGLAIEPNNKSLLDELAKLPASKSTETPKLNKPKPAEQRRRLPINVIDDSYTKSKAVEQSKSEKEAKSTILPPPVKKADPVVADATPAKKEATSSIKVTQKSSISTSPLKLACPRTNFEFERDWKTYKGRGDDVLYQYFLVIPPKEYASIFKSSLESDQFEKMIELVDTRYAKEKSAQDIYNVLEGLSRVKRVDMLIMFIDTRHRQALQRLFDLLKTNLTEIPVSG
ncbi:hypothetical protein [Parasitella parasitica]|uniref:RNA polymerase II-associated protein 3 n=1 Tax=Parasitella parasitica TaxID=35722 RepID=A0A0B7N344_9FUNG|nr:hypothetical protein [Parasitella parasitica]